MWRSARVDGRDLIGKLSRYKVELLNTWKAMKNRSVGHIIVI